MDHGDHGGHGDMNMPKCELNMLWNYQVENTCVVFPSWHISGWAGMLFSWYVFHLDSHLTIIAISVGYAALLAHMQRYEHALAARLAQVARPAVPGTGAYTAVEGEGKPDLVQLPKHIRMYRAGMYAVSVAISYFLMLVAMTYNMYLCAAIVIGAFAGHMVYENELDLSAALAGTTARGLACH